MQKESTETNEKPESLALEGIRVLEMGSLIAGPFAGRLMADFGAEVIKVEPPAKGDPLRKWRLMHEDTSLWWYVQSRNKKCITIDLNHVDGQEIIRKLAKEVDVIIENFKPGTMEKWGIGYEDLKKINPNIISVGEAMGGIRYLTGYPDRPPTRVGISLGDSVSALYAVMGALMAIHHRDKGGKGQYIDVALYETIFSLMESAVPEYDKFNCIRERTGSTLPGISPSNTYLCKDNKYVVIGGNGDGIFKRLMQAIGKDELKDDERFAFNDDRVKHMGYLDQIIGEWTRENTLEDALEILNKYNVPAGAIYSIEDMFQDPHFKAREMITDLDIEGLGKLKVPGIVPKLSETPGKINWAGPKLGEHTEEILKEKLGLSTEEINRMIESGII
jgi:crotonobetainyl-CoA:carnitine CoA-transferase CaiB-like acyl-CoA transferase